LAVRIGIALALAALLGQLPAEPDFSGRWVLDSLAPAPPDAPLTIIVEQPVVRANVRGEPITPSYLRVSIRRERASGATDETRWIGTIGGRIGGTAGPRGQPASRSPEQRLETTWRDHTLVFLDSQFGPDGRHTGNWSERRESWSLEPDGRLRVEIVMETRDQPQQTPVSLYKRR
jgi:hypothetical protein